MAMPAADWRPRRWFDGKQYIYCSPGCGGKQATCTEAKYLAAVAAADALCAKLGFGWKPVVHENLGWFASATCGHLRVVDSRQNYPAAYPTPHFAAYTHGRSASGPTPRLAVEAVLAGLRQEIVDLSSILAEVERA